MTPSIARASVLLLVSALPLTSSAQDRPSTQFFYDNNGNITMSVDALNRPTHTAYDPLNRVNQMTLPVPGPFQGNPTIRVERNGQDATTKVTDPRGLVTSYAVSGLGDPFSQASPDTGVTNRTFDSNGRLASQTDARGRTVSFDYDAIGRVTRARYDDGTATLFYYDEAANAIGRLSRVVDPGPITTSWTYDTNGRVLSKTQVVGSGSTVPIQAVVYSYVPGTSKLASIKYPSGKTVAYAYNTTTRELESVTLDGQPIATSVVFHTLGDVKQMVLGNGLVWSSELDVDGRMTGYTLAGQLYRVTWDAANRVTSIVNTADPFWDRSFGYDNLDRITSFTSTPRSQTFVYDLSGNLTAKGDVIDGALANYTYYIDPSSNRMTQIASLGVAYSHDAAGNRTGDGRLSFQYDARGRMSRAVVTSGALTETFDYSYNASGLRVRKLDATGALIFLYDEQGRLLGEYDEAGLPQSEHVWIEGRPVAVVDYLYGGKKPKKEKKKVKDNKKDKGTQTTEVFYVETDHLMTPRMITDAGKARRWYWHSAPYGDTAPNEDPTAKGVVEYNLRFPGQYYDAETSLHYNWNRDYETTSGRYVQSDPIGLDGGVNTYSYANLNPLRFIDPYGTQFIDPRLRIADQAAGVSTSGPLSEGVYIGAGVNASATGPMAGGSVEVGVKGGGFPLNGCFYVQSCVIVGPGVAVSAGGATTVGTGKLCSGTQTSSGVIWQTSIGGIGESGQITSSGRDIQVSGSFGPTLGYNAGLLQCVEKQVCAR